MLAYDTVYALADNDDDIKAGAKSSAVWLADLSVKVIAIFYVAAFCGCLFLAFGLISAFFIKWR